MSKLPLETRPLRLAPALAETVEELLRPLSGKRLDAAQRAVLQVYRSGAQMDHGGWVAAYAAAIAAAAPDREVAT